MWHGRGGATGKTLVVAALAAAVQAWSQVPLPWLPAASTCLKALGLAVVGASNLGPAWLPHKVVAGQNLVTGTFSRVVGLIDAPLVYNLSTIYLAHLWKDKTAAATPLC